MTSTINWGIIGLGKIAHKFADDLAHVPNARLHAVASSDAQRAADFAQKYGVQYYFADYEALLDCPDIDVIYVASTHPLHCRHAIMCLERGINVLCEKPMGMNAHEVRQMVAAARANDAFLMEAIWTRFIPSFEKMLSLIESGVIGTPLSMKADFGFAAPFNAQSRIWNKALGASALLDIGIYPIFLAQMIFGKPTKIQAMATMSETGIDATCAVNLQYANGAIAMCYASIREDTPIEATIQSEKGRLTLHPRFHHSDKLSLKMYDNAASTDEEKNETVFSMPFEGRGYHFEAMAVQECLKNGLKEHPKLPLSTSLDLAETLDAIRREIGLVFPNHDFDM